MTEPPPTAISNCALAARARAAPSITLSRGEWAVTPAYMPPQRGPSAAAIRVANPASPPNERVLST